jgi:hypothetical protein
MKRLCILVALSLTLPIAYPQTSTPPSYKSGRLIDLRRDSTGYGAACAQDSLCLAVELGEVSYLFDMRHIGAELMSRPTW